MEEFKIGDPILVRSRINTDDVWEPRIYLGAKDNTVYLDGGWHPTKDDFFFIPFNEETKGMIGSYMTWEEPWEPKPGELVAVKDDSFVNWVVRVFVKKCGKLGYYCTQYSVDDGHHEYWDQCEPVYKHFNIPSNPTDE